MRSIRLMNRRAALRHAAHASLWLMAPRSAWSASAATVPQGVYAGREIAFPRDFGAHPETLIEWWYATGVLHAPQRTFGFQITFFRNRTPLAPSASRFNPQQLLFAHAAVTDLSDRRLRHDQRIARQGFERAQAAEDDTGLQLGSWQLRREGPPTRSVYQARAQSDLAGFDLALTLTATQPVVLQGQRGFSRKGPQAAQASHYYSEPQLAVSGTLGLDKARHAVSGQAWLDHEWSDALLDPQATGWDWIGMNLADGSALTAFRLRRADGGTVWAGGSFRRAGGNLQDFGPNEVSFTSLREWQSPHSQARYPVEHRVSTPAGVFTVRALLDDQELDSRQSTGAVYWEGLSECLDALGQVVGQGYLEMTGYVARLQF